MARAIVQAQTPRSMSWTADAADAWEAFYVEQSEHRHAGMLAAITARSEAQVTRLALTYALIDAADAIDVPHLEAAREVWRYAVDSARCIFGDSTGNRHADVLRGWLTDAGEVTWNDAKRELGLRTAADMSEVVDALLSLDLVELAERPHPTGGRAVRVIRSKGAKGAKDTGGTQVPEREALT